MVSLVPTPEAGPWTEAVARWRHASKLDSWPKTLVPTLLGQAIGFAAVGRFSVGGAVLGGLFAVFATVYVVWLNDWADQDVDALKRRRFPDGCSPKTIPDGILPAPVLLMAGVGAALLAFGVAIVASLAMDRAFATVGALFGLSIFAAYSLPPGRVNYRGGGELLEMVGIGVFLPWFSAYLQSGEVWSRELWVLLGFVPLCLASAVASGLADEETDREGGKVTFTTTMGNEASRRLAEGCLAGAGVVWAISARVFPDLLPPLVWLGVVAVLWVHYSRVTRASEAAVTRAFDAQRTYKKHLHRAVWHSGLALAVALWWWG